MPRIINGVAYADNYEEFAGPLPADDDSSQQPDDGSRRTRRRDYSDQEH